MGRAASEQQIKNMCRLLSCSIHRPLSGFPAWLLLFLSSVPLFAATGVLQVTVRDAQTHYALQANINLAGPQQLTAQTNNAGRVILTLDSGEYRIDVSAPGHKSLKTHYNVEGGSNPPLGIMLDPVSPPTEESPEAISSEIRTGFTLLHGYTVDGETGQPVPGVKVRVAQVDVQTVTDSNGHYSLSVPTPIPQSPGGAGTDTLTYEKPGYKTVVFDNFAISGEEMGGNAIDLEKGNGVIEHDATHKMMRGETGSAEDPQSAIPAYSIPRNLYGWLGTAGTSIAVGPVASTTAAIVVPNSIRVGTGGSSTKSYQPCASKTTCTNVLTMSLESYVNQGLLSEWLSSWALDSLKAGAVAYRSYGAYYVANPVSTNYDICNTTACQVYDPWDSPPNKTSQAAASGTAGVVLSSDNVNIFRAEYAAESNLASDTTYATCPDDQVGEPANNWPCMKDPIDVGEQQSSTHSRGMCQRGSQRWATGKDATGAPGDTGTTLTTPRDWRCILDHYYNANSNSIPADPNGTGNPGAGSGLRTAFLQGNLPYGLIAYEAYNTTTQSADGIRAANAADGSGDYAIVGGNSYDPSWEPGGRRLAFSNGTGIAVINADGTGLTQLTSNGCTQNYETCDFAPAWSPFSERIAFCSARSGTTQVWIMNSDGSNLHQITTNLNLQDSGLESIGNPGYEEEDCNLKWKSDESSIALTGVTAQIPYKSQYNLYLLSSDGAYVTQLTSCLSNNPNGPSVCDSPDWSPDGKHIVINDDDTNYGDNYQGAGIYTINPDGTGLTPVTLANSWHEWFPRYSTDGRKIFFTSDPSIGTWGVWSMNSDGTGQVQIVGARKSYQVNGSIDCSICGSFGAL